MWSPQTVRNRQTVFGLIQAVCTLELIRSSRITLRLTAGCFQSFQALFHIYCQVICQPVSFLTLTHLKVVKRLP